MLDVLQEPTPLPTEVLAPKTREGLELVVGITTVGVVSDKSVEPQAAPTSPIISGQCYRPDGCPYKGGPNGPSCRDGCADAVQGTPGLPQELVSEPLA